MQINRRDYIEYQLEESSGSTDDKLDYRVAMAIEKNTQLVSC